MTDGEQQELQERFEELQQQYDELRILVARYGIQLPPSDGSLHEERERRKAAFTLIKGGLAAFVGLLGYLLGSAKARPVISGLLVAGVTGVGVFAALPAPTPQIPRAVLVSPSHHRRRRIPVVPVARRTHDARRSAAPRRALGGARVSRSHYLVVPTPVPAETPPQPTPSPSPTPAVPSPVPRPHPKPHPSHHGRHCIVYAVILGERVCVKYGIGVPT